MYPPKAIRISEDVPAGSGTTAHGTPAISELATARPSRAVFAQVVVGREGHQDTLTLRVELAPDTPADSIRAAVEAAIRDVMKLRGSVDIVAVGTIPDGAKKIDDQLKWD